MNHLLVTLLALALSEFFDFSWARHSSPTQRERAGILCIRQGLLTYQSIMPVQHFSLHLCSYYGSSWKDGMRQKNISLCGTWITDYEKLSLPRRGLRAKISNKHEINSLPADIKGVYICTYQNFLKVLQCRLRYLTITGACKKKRSLGCSCSSSSPPLRLVLPSLLTLMVSKWVSHPSLSPPLS